MPNDLTEKQKKWAESYVKHFNATKACEEAGYAGNKNVLGQQGFDNLNNPKIQAFMREALGYCRETERNNKIASMAEIMEFYSEGMRGNIKDQFGLDAMMSDRIKCANSLDKILQMTEKAKAEEGKDDALTINTCYGTGDSDE
jgi:phage terminase small subunit